MGAPVGVVLRHEHALEMRDGLHVDGMYVGRPVVAVFVVCVYVAQNGAPLCCFSARRQLSALQPFRGMISFTACSSASRLASRFVGGADEAGGLPGRNLKDVLTEGQYRDRFDYPRDTNDCVPEVTVAVVAAVLYLVSRCWYPRKYRLIRSDSDSVS